MRFTLDPLSNLSNLSDCFARSSSARCSDSVDLAGYAEFAGWSSSATTGISDKFMRDRQPQPDRQTQPSHASQPAFSESTSTTTERLRVRTTDGMTLDGCLMSPEVVGSQGATDSVEVWLLVHGTGGNFYSPGVLETFTAQMAGTVPANGAASAPWFSLDATTTGG